MIIYDINGKEIIFFWILFQDIIIYGIQIKYHFNIMGMTILVREMLCADISLLVYCPT